MKQGMKTQHSGVNLTRASFCQSYQGDEEPRVRPKLFLRQSAVSQESSNTSETTASKVNYKYERVNNTYKLVPISNPDPQPPTNRNTLLMIHSLCERVDRLEKQHQYEEEKQLFKVRGMVEQEVKECVRKALQKQDSQHVDRIAAIGKEVEAAKRELLHDQVGLGKLETSLHEWRENYHHLSSALNNTLNSTQRELKMFVHEWENQVEAKIKAHLAHLMQAKPHSLNTQLKGTPLTILQHRSTISLKSPSIEQDILTTYAIDQDGYLLDSQLYYMLDWKDERIKLTSEQVQQIKNVK